MKKISLIPLLVFIVLSASLSSCELFGDKNDDCDATKMDQTEEPVIYIKVETSFPENAITFYTPEKVIISGSIRKIYCSGKESGYFTYSPTFFVTRDDFYLTNVSNFVLPQPYQYKFANTMDKLIVMLRVKIYVEEGHIYESEEISKEFFYKDLMFDFDNMKHSVLLYGTSALQWYEVTSK